MTKQSIEKKICDAALKLSASHHWQTLTLQQISKTAKVPLTETKKIFTNKADILPEIVHQIDDEVVRIGKINARNSPHDRLFEVMMARFDILQSHREGVLAIFAATKRSPPLALPILQAQWQSMPKMLKLAHLVPKGIPSSAMCFGLLAIYQLTLCVWLKDGTVDMSKTMAVLDRRLRYAGYLSEFFFHNHN